MNTDRKSTARTALTLPRLILVLVLAQQQSVSAGTPAPGFEESTALSGLHLPTAVRFASDGRVFVAEKRGVIKVFTSLSDPNPVVFADLRTNVFNYWDRGLTGLALHPDFPNTPDVYVGYTLDAEIGGVPPRWGAPDTDSDNCPNPPGGAIDGCIAAGRVSRLHAVGNSTSGPEQVLIESWCQQFPSHSVDSVVFGPDGALYISAGDGASFALADYGQYGSPRNLCGDPPVGVGGVQVPPTAEGGALRSQSLRRPSNEPVVLSGTILRVDPLTGAALADNPLNNDPRPNSSRIIAYGFRNPFRIAFRPGTRELWVGDVGWQDWEEIDRIMDPTDSVVENFGWPCFEGAQQQSGYAALGLNTCNSLYAIPGAVTPPHFTYSHASAVVPGEACGTASASVSGLAFYNGGGYPPAFASALFFADYSRNCIWSMFADANGVPDPNTRSTFVAGAAHPVDLQIGPGGDLFYVDIEGGTIRRIQWVGANHRPVPVIQAQPTYGAIPLTVNFDARNSSDADAGDTLTYAWDLDGDGQFDDATSATPQYTYTTAGTRIVGLQVTDPHGLTGVATISIAAGNTPPLPVILNPSTSSTWSVGDAIPFSGTATDAEDGALPPAALSWEVIIHHCPSDCHTHFLQGFSGADQGMISAPNHDYPAHLELRLTATDFGGLSATTSVLLYPKTVPLTFQSSPPGLTVAANSSGASTPFMQTVIVGSANTVSAPGQSVAGVPYQFASWSDGGTQTHTIVAPASPATYLALFAVAPTPTATPTITPGLVAAYAFDEGTGMIAHDASGAGNHGALSDLLAWTGGKLGPGALNFPGAVGGYVTIPHSTSLEIPAALTIEAWVYPTVLDGNLRMIVGKEMSTPYFDTGWTLFGLGWDGQNKPAAVLYDNDTNGWFSCRADMDLTLNSWSHVAMTYDQSTGAHVVYINGIVSRSCDQGPHAIKLADQPLRIGGSRFDTVSFKGAIDEVRIWNYARSAAQIAIDRDAGISTLTPTPTTTPSPSSTATRTATTSVTSTPTWTSTLTPFPTASWTPSRTLSPTPTRSASPTPTPSPLPTRTNTTTPSSTASAVPTPTPSRTGTSTSTITPPPVASPTPSPVVTASVIAGLSGQITYYSNGSTVRGAVVDLQGEQPGHATTDADGRFSFSNLNSGEWRLQPSKSGDWQHGVTALDASYVLQGTVGARTFSALELIACDTTGDGRLTAIDASRILQAAVGLIPRVDVAQRCGSDFGFIPTAAAAPNRDMIQLEVADAACQPGAIVNRSLLGNVADQNFTAVLFGDCTGSWQPAGGAAAVLPSDATRRVRLSPPRLRGRRVRYAIYASTATPYSALELALSYSAADLRLLTVRRRFDADITAMQYATDDGVVRIAAASAAQMVSDGVIFLLEFRPYRAVLPANAVTLTRGVIDDEPVPVENPTADFAARSLR